MAIKVNEEQRRYAKTHARYILQLSIDGRHLKDEELQEQEFTQFRSLFEITTGSMPEQAAKELLEWYRKWTEKL